ncbi:hypothetical protein J2S53_002813 [Actinopolyspora lacussalsi]|nr:hypothetical protein [Actinopolyspora lacussalsi]
MRLPSTFRVPDDSSWSPCGDAGELPQVEGTVVDTTDGTRYAGRETVGLRRMRADPRGATSNGDGRGSPMGAVRRQRASTSVSS